MNRKEAEDFVYKSYMKAEKHQAYAAPDAAKRRPDLTREILRRRSLTPCAVVTGSKGKGSVASMISQILQIRFRVGLMTSPHLESFCERFRINGTAITDDDLAKYMTMIRPEIEAIDEKLPENVCISPMGIQADLALTYFNAERTGFNVLECGKGAKYDDVNNAVHAYAVINSVFPEHTRELGATVEEIALDKAHVITGGGEQKCVYVGPQQPEVMRIIKERAERTGTALKVYGEDFWAEKIRWSMSGMIFDVIAGDRVVRDIFIPLMGEHQARNCALAMALCMDVLEETGETAAEQTCMVTSRAYGIEDHELEDIKEKLSQLNWPGRLDVISADPFILLDACIHPQSCRYVKDVMMHLGIEKATVVIGIPDDKDFAGVAREMRPVAEQFILTRSQNPHYLFSKEQTGRLSEMGITAVWTETVEEAVDSALSLQRPVVILGTTSVVAEVKKLQASSGGFPEPG